MLPRRGEGRHGSRACPPTSDLTTEPPPDPNPTPPTGHSPTDNHQRPARPTTVCAPFNLNARLAKKLDTLAWPPNGDHAPPSSPPCVAPPGRRSDRRALPISNAPSANDGRPSAGVERLGVVASELTSGPRKIPKRSP